MLPRCLALPNPLTDISSDRAALLTTQDMLSVLTELHHDLGSTAQAHCARPISESGKPGKLIEIVEVFDSRP
jgi:hypothetical protein